MRARIALTLTFQVFFFLSAVNSAILLYMFSYIHFNYIGFYNGYIWTLSIVFLPYLPFFLRDFKQFKHYEADGESLF